MCVKSLAENTGIFQRALDDIRMVARRYDTEKIMLFGSRARGSHQEKSDIDLAVYGCKEFVEFVNAMEEDVWTLLEFDLINMDDSVVSRELKTEIKRDGVLIYEKI